jgi:hypothetical protein
VRKLADSSAEPVVGSLAAGKHKTSHFRVDNRTNSFSFKYLAESAQKFTPCTKVRALAHRSSLLASHKSSRFAWLSTTKVRALCSIQHRNSPFASHNSLIYKVFFHAERLAGLFNKACL